jgi:hypothetical protein
MKFAPLKREPVSQDPNETSYLLEPSAGVMSSFINRMSNFPRTDGSDNLISGTHFSGFRLLICLHEDGKSFFTNLINHLNEEDPTQWPLRVLESDSARQVLDALEPEYIARVVDYFLDRTPSTEFQRLNLLVANVWPKTEEPAKN